MNRLAGIIVAVIGLLIAVLSLAKILPGLTQTGFYLILLGILIIGLSFVPKPATEETERMSTPGTLAGMFFSPTEVFQNLRRHPRWLVAVLIMSLLSVVYTNLFMNRLTPERVVNYAVDKTLQMSFLNDDARKQIESGRAQAIEENKNPVLRAAQGVNAFVAQTFLYAFLGAVFFLFALAMGGKMNYWQAFSAAVYAAFPLAVIRFVLNSIILYVKDPVEIHPILGQSALYQDNLNFLVTPSESPVLFTLLGSFSLMLFAWIWFNATGLKNAGERVSPTIAWTASIAIWVIMVFLGVVMAFLFPSFIS